MPAITLLEKSEIKSLEERIRDALLDLAVRKGIVKRREDAIVRDILPATDLGFPAERWAESVTANSWTTIVSMRVPQTKIFVFYGAKSKISDPLTTLIRFSEGAAPGRVKDVINVEQLSTIKNRELIFEVPILYENGTYMRIDFYAKATGTDELILLGYVVEPKGEIISSK